MVRYVFIKSPGAVYTSFFTNQETKMWHHVAAWTTKTHAIMIISSYDMGVDRCDSTVFLKPRWWCPVPRWYPGMDDYFPNSASMI